MLEHMRMSFSLTCALICLLELERRGAELQLAFLNLQTVLGTAVDVNGAAKMNSIHHLSRMSH